MALKEKNLRESAFKICVNLREIKKRFTLIAQIKEFTLISQKKIYMK